MLAYLFRRVLIALPILVLITVLNFMFIQLSPGDPVRMRIPPEMWESGLSVSDEWIEEQRELLGLNQPLPLQYVRWLGKILQGEFGTSLSMRREVAPLITSKLWPTIKLTGLGFLVSIVVGIGVGVLSAVKQYSFWDYAATLLSFVALSVPNFFLSLVFIYFFAIKLKWFPTGGMMTLGGQASIGDQLRHLMLPVMVLGLSGAASLVRYTRSAMLEVMRMDYITTARSKGLGDRKIILGHTFRNALLPVITVISLSLPSKISGAVIVEQIFSWPGMGSFAVQAAFSKDYPVLMALNLIIASLVLMTNLMADLAYAIADPRIRYS